MAVKVLPYDMESYNLLIRLWDASKRLSPVSDRTRGFSETAKVFLEHHVQDLLSVILLHNRFSMEPGQKLVTVATPWGANTTSEVLKKVNGTSFRFTSGAVTPYEFAHGTKEFPLGGEAMQKSHKRNT